MKFIRNLIACVLGFFISIFLLIIFFAGTAGAMLSFEGNEIIVKSNSVLELDLSKPIKDYNPFIFNNPIEKVLDINEKLGLNKILNAIDNAKNDSNIKGISIKSFKVNAGIAQIQAIRNKLKEFKKTGKFIYAYNDSYLQKTYYLCSVADSVFLNPMGEINLKGLSTEILYYKDFEDKYGIKMEVVRHGKYKSAVEPFISNKMSEANRKQTTSFLKSIWSEITHDISKSRHISVKKINNIANNLLGRTSKLAKENNLIDQVIYEDQYDEKLKFNSGSNKLNKITIDDYIYSGKGKIKSYSKNKIAVIYAQGNIEYGEGNENVIGQDVINKAIKKAVKDDKVRAIVLRVNSPGGSALASELIWRELKLAKEKKPLVVSMGNLAASGGYYISCIADKIVAEPTTITGSIGVFGVLLNMYEFSKKMGINAEQVSTNNSPNYSLFEPLNKEFYNVTLEGVENIYKTFVNRVSQSRNMTFEQVNEIAQGRVWSGKEALEKGLVDQLGGLQDAISIASNLAGIKKYRIRNYPIYKKNIKNIFNTFTFVKIYNNKILKEMLGVGDDVVKLYNRVKEIKKMKGIQARVPYLLNIY